ncbi:hypothetical protein [Nitrospirillum pindoramense]|uniref:hypothetical protein n=1 Tax=Nitrospirillum amazonense TaxID=28077 RepID=UPI0011A006CB|nr:hypothetical protein [Nitrospirillum amazonense]
MTISTIPQDKTTLVIIINHKKDDSAIDLALRNLSIIDNDKKINQLRLYDFIEEFMFKSSDHWFVDPRHWEAVDKEKKEYIRNLINNPNSTMSDHWIGTIFEETRKSLSKITLSTTP